MKVYTLREKYIDNILMLFLVFTGGGLLFVFNRNFMYYTFLTFLIVCIFVNYYRIKRDLLNSSIFTTILVLVLFLINYFFAVNEQSVDKYLYYLT